MWVVSYGSGILDPVVLKGWSDDAPNKVVPIEIIGVTKIMGQGPAGRGRKTWTRLL